MSADDASPIRQRGLSKLQQRLMDCYEQGLRLTDCDKNYDYAHMMFAECVVHDPARLAYVEAMLRNLRAKFPRHNKKLPFLGHGGIRSLSQAVDAKDRIKVFLIGIELLKSNPWDIQTLRLLAQACAHFHYNEVELVYLKQALDANPRDIETNRHCALSLARMGQFDQAIACWHRIEKARPRDKEAPRMIVQLSEEKRKYPGGRPLMKASPTTIADEPTSKAIEVSFNPPQEPAEAFEQSLRDDSTYLELADLRATAEARRNAGQKRDPRLFRMTWLEITIVLTVIAFVLQLSPNLASATWAVFDFRHWSRQGWFAAGIVYLVLLFFARFQPEFSRGGRRS